jgi:hypothetical protein
MSADPGLGEVDPFEQIGNCFYIVNISASKKLADKFEASLKELKGAIESAEMEISSKPKDRRVRTKALSLKQRLLTWTEAKKSLRIAIDFTLSLCVCPVCENRNFGTDDILLRGNCTFEAICDRCESRWGLGICGICGKKHPFIKIASIERCISDQSVPGWEEMSIGQDMLSAPTRNPDGHISFSCPWCGGN